MLGKLLAGSDAETQRAFAVARAALAKHHASSDLEYYDLTDELDPHVMECATTDAFAESVKRVFAFDPGNLEGDLLNAFAMPAYLLGMATAFLVLRGNVDDVMGGAR